MPFQLSIFQEEAKKEEEYTLSEEAEDLMDGLEALNKMAEASNNLLTLMIANLQKDWTEDQKLQIHDPKEYYRQQKLKQKQDIIMPEFTTEAIEVLKNSRVEGKIVKLPEGQLERNVYTEVKKNLELIGGRWKGGKVYGFVFDEDPKDLLNQIASGEKRNLKKEFQFFGTPDALADRLVDLANPQKGHYILEPSAGQGAIVKAINRRLAGEEVFCFELMPLNKTFLQKIPTAIILGEDFLLSKHDRQFDRIIANPPFAKNQDIDHIRKMYEVLKDGGRMVTVASKHWQHSSNKKETDFRKWLEVIEADVIEVEAGEFKESGTTVATVIILINK